MDEIGGDPGVSLFSGGLFSRLDACDKALQSLKLRNSPLGRLLALTDVNARGLILAVAALLLLILLPRLVEGFLHRRGYVRPNFRNDSIPICYGLFPLLFCVALFLLTLYLTPSSTPLYSLWIVAIVVFGLLGYWDDTRGNRDYRGLKGHIRALFVERKATTGFVKAAGGLMCALWLGWRLYPSEGRFLVAALLIALSANAINLLDVRPGRACGVFLALGTPLLLIQGLRPMISPLFYAVLSAWQVWRRDSRGQVMMGDTGSNVLGASLGLALASPSFSLWVQVVTTLALIALHGVTERVSLTALIESKPALKWLDSLTGVR